MMGNVFWQLLKKTFSETKFFWRKNNVKWWKFPSKNLVSEKVFFKSCQNMFPIILGDFFFAVDNFFFIKKKYQIGKKKLCSIAWKKCSTKKFSKKKFRHFFDGKSSVRCAFFWNPNRSKPVQTGPNRSKPVQMLDRFGPVWIGSVFVQKMMRLTKICFCIL